MHCSRTFAGFRQNGQHYSRRLRGASFDLLIDTTDFSQTPEINEADPSREKIEALAEIICGVGEESAAALFVLMGRVQNSEDPVALANTTKHFAFTRCGELNLYGMVDAQMAVIESELLERAVIS